MDWYDGRVKNGLAVVIRDTRQAYRFALQNNKYFLVVLIPPKETVYRHLLARPASVGLADPFALFEIEMRKAGIPTLNATTALTAYAKSHPAELVYFAADIHLSEVGHRILADDIIRHLRLLPPSTTDKGGIPSQQPEKRAAI